MVFKEEEGKEEKAFVLKCKMLSDLAIIPRRHHEFDVGYDLHSAENVFIPPASSRLIRTDIALEFPRGTYGRIAERSGLAIKHQIAIGGGVLDPGFRGNVCVIMHNLGKVPFEVILGARVAQVILHPYLTAHVEVVNELGSSGGDARGESGFGSTGV